MWAANTTLETFRWFVIPFLMIWCPMMGSLLYSGRRVIPKVLDRWANEEGYKVIRKDTVGLFKWIAVGASNIQTVHSIVVVDRSGASRSGVVKIGGYWWPSLSTDRCPIEVYWDRTKPDCDWPEL